MDTLDEHAVRTLLHEAARTPEPASDERPRMAIRNADVADGANERPVLPDRAQQGDNSGGNG